MDPEKTKYPSVENQTKRWFGVRHIQFILMFFVILIGYGMRTNLSVAIVPMMAENPPDPDIPTFPEWTTKNTLLSSFFWGYIIPQVVAGQLGKNYGPKWFLAVSTFVNSLCCLLLPMLAIECGETGVLVCRIVQGFSQGFLIPSLHNLLGKWTPLVERSMIGSFVHTGGPLGIGISTLITGQISNSTAGWPAAFYFYGSIGMVWVVLWMCFGSNSPAEHRWISDVEVRFIDNDRNAEDNQQHLITPWREMLTSLPFWAILVAHCGQNWGFCTLQTEIPSYMDKIMNYNVNESSYLAALPYFILWVLNFVFSTSADVCIRRYLSIGTTRKLFNSIGILLPAGSLVCLAFVDSSQKTLALVLLAAAVGLNAACYSGYNVNHIDIAPNFAGTLMGFTNCVSNVASLLAPLAVDALGDDETDPTLWREVFLIAAGLYTVSNTFFIIFGSGEVQKWNNGKTDDVEKDQIE